MLRRANPAATAAEALADGAVATEALPLVLLPPLDPGDEEEQLLPLAEAPEDANRRSAGSQLAF